MDRSSNGAANRSVLIEKLNNEKQQLYNQLKELVGENKSFHLVHIDHFLDGNSY